MDSVTDDWIAQVSKLCKRYGAYLAKALVYAGSDVWKEKWYVNINALAGAYPLKYYYVNPSMTMEEIEEVILSLVLDQISEV
jgi:hypothetical protein